MDFRQLRHVLALVESRGFHKAAETLRITQPALTKSIQLIENDLGVRLFDRSGKGVVPTVFGEIVARTAREVAGALDGMARAIRQTSDLTAGELSVGAGAYVADVWLGQITGRLLRRFPRLKLSIHVDHWETLPDALRQGRIDVFIANVERVRGRKEFQVIEFPHQRGIWVCRAGHPLAGRAGRSRAALGDFALVGPPVPDPIRRWLEDDGNHPRVLDRKIDTSSLTMIKSMLREGDAVSLVHPDSVRPELASGEFVILDFDAPALFLEAGVAWLADRSLSPAADMFLRELMIEVGLDPEVELQVHQVVDSPE